MTLPLFPEIESGSTAKVLCGAFSNSPLLTACISAASVKWATPAALYEALDREFSFTLDPCPITWQPGDPDGLRISWRGHRVFCNPPYGRSTSDWLCKSLEADLAVYLLPSRTDTAWFHEWAPRAAEVRFVRGRLKFGAATAGAPFPSLLLIYRRQP